MRLARTLLQCYQSGELESNHLLDPTQQQLILRLHSLGLNLHFELNKKFTFIVCVIDGCEKFHVEQAYLSQHMKLCEGKLHLCDECGKRFTTQL